MELSPFERLLLWQQYEILKHTNPEEVANYEVAQEALRAGYKRSYNQVLPNMEKELSDRQAEYVLNVLDMYDALSRVEETTGKPLEGIFSHFCGFDGHTESAGFAHFFVEKLQRYQSLKIKQFDAHMPIDDLYKRMLHVWLSLGDVSRRFNLTETDAKSIIAAASYHEDT